MAVTANRKPLSGPEERAVRLDLNITLSAARLRCMKGAQYADNIRDTALLARLHEAVAALDDAIELNERG